MRAGLLCNPLSGRLQRTGSLPELAGATHCLQASEPAAIDAAVAELLADALEVLVVAGGDGTLHAVLDSLLRRDPARLPLVAVIPAGTTNMTALDLGVRGRPARVLRRLGECLAGRAEPQVVERSVLRVEQPGRPARHGMFFGTGCIASGVRYFRERVRGRGLTGESASGLVILGFLARLLFRRNDPLLQPAIMSIGNGGGGRREGRYGVFLASSLHRLLLGMRPYWGSESAPIHVTMVNDSPERFWRSLIPLVAGRGRRLQGRAGYRSYNTSRLELGFTGDYVIDGELYHAERDDGPLTIAAAGPVRFLVP